MPFAFVGREDFVVVHQAAFVQIIRQFSDTPAQGDELLKRPIKQRVVVRLHPQYPDLRVRP